MKGTKARWVAEGLRAIQKSDFFLVFHVARKGREDHPRQTPRPRQRKMQVETLVKPAASLAAAFAFWKWVKRFGTGSQGAKKAESKGLPPPPPEIFEPHHHFFDPQNEDTAEFQAFVKGLGVPKYSPEQFLADAKGLNIVGTAHIEGMTDAGGGAAEAAYLEKLANSGRAPIKAIIAGSENHPFLAPNPCRSLPGAYN
jgi:hypothetical protein